MRYLILFFIPTFAYAASTFKEVVGKVLEFNQLLVLVIFSLALLIAIWKIIDTWVLHSGDAESIEKGKKVVIVAIIVLVIMAGLWGILGLLTSSFSSVVGGGGGSGGASQQPSLPSSTSI